MAPSSSSSSIKLSNAIALTSANFRKDGQGRWFVIHPAFKGKSGMIAFMAGWCGHCQRLKPDYDKTAKMTGSAYPLGYVDCVSQAQLASKMGIQGYPTIKLVNSDGSIGANYSGDRSSPGMVAYVCEHGAKNSGFCSGSSRR